MATLRCGARPAADGAVAVDQVRLIPQHSLPFRGLLEEVVPSDRVVMRRIETPVVDPEADFLMWVADQPAVPGKAREDREIALGHAEGHVYTSGIAPFGDHKPAAQQQTVRSAARTHRPEGLVPR